MQLKSSLLLLWHLVQQIKCEDQSRNDTLDYNEFRFKHGEPIDYASLVKKMKAKNKTEDYPSYGTEWMDFTENTNLLLDLSIEHDTNQTSTTDSNLNFWIPENAHFLTFPPDNETTRLPEDFIWTTYDLTYFQKPNWTFADEKKFHEVRDFTQNTYMTLASQETETELNTEHDFMIDINDTYVYDKYGNMTSSEEERELHIKDFYPFTITTKPPPITTWNPFLIQSEERAELDRIAKEKRMATNNAMRDALKSGQFGGLGGLFGGGIIPINLGNLGNLGNLMGGLKTVSIKMAGGTTGRITETTPQSTLSRKTFRPRPNPQDFMKWKFLEDGSPRPPMREDEFIRIIQKYSTPPPYYMPPVSIGANLSESILEQLNSNNNVTMVLECDEAQRDRIFNLINPFVQQHTAMDLLNVNDRVDMFTAPSTTAKKHSEQHPSSKKTHEMRVFTTEPLHNRTTYPWRANWSRTGPETTNPFDQENLLKVLNEGREGNHPWKLNAFKEKLTPQYDDDPKLRELEKNFDNIFDKDAQIKRQEQADKALEEINRQKEKLRKKGITRSLYWKESLKKNVEPLYEETSSTTESKSAELRRLFSMLSKDLTSEPYNMFNWDQETSTISAKIFENTPDKRVQEQREKQFVTTTSRWTTPIEDRERLQTILSFMFPYIEKKSEIFETGQKKKEDKQSDRDTKHQTTFDPWGDEESEPPPPEFRNLFQHVINATKTRS